MTKLAFIAVPYWLGRKDEYSGSVDIVKKSGIAREFNAKWINLSPDFDAYDDPVNAVNQAVADAMKKAIRQKRFPLIVADDCTVCLGSMKGLEDFSPDVLWYDAHGDFNTEETSPSGFLGGMPLAAMVGLGNQNLMTGIDLEPIESSRIYLTDGRDLDEGEAQLVSESNLIHWQTLDDEFTHDWDNRPLYIHFDGDVIRLEDHPAVGYPAEGGPNMEDCIASLRHAIMSADVKAIHFTCWNATLEGAEQSQETIMTVIRSVAEELHG
ncbi:MAG: arginase [Phototrophicaceae bacterium]